MLTAIGSGFVPVKAYAAESATEESEEAGTGEETQGDGAADTVLTAQPSANSASDIIADEAADNGGKKTDEEPTVEPEVESATEAASESPAGSSETTDTDSSDESKEGVSRLSDGERRTLEDVRWKLVRDKSEYGSRFQAIREGDVFYFAPDIKAYGLKSEVDLPEIKVTIVAADESASGNGISGNKVSDNSISGNTVSDNASPKFDQFMIVGGIKVSVTAPEGVFPEDAVLKVKRIDDAASNQKIEQAVKEDMGLSDAAEVNGVKPDGEGDSEDGSSASSGESLNYISFDITITDVSGNEIQPDTEYGKANVTFSQVDIISDYLSAPGEETEGKLSAEEETDQDEGNSDNIGFRKTKDGGRVFIIGDDTDKGASSSKKSLRMYYFDNDLETMEKLDTTLDEADRAVGVETEHFSTYTAAIGTSEDYDAGTYGKFKISCTGAKVEITCKNASGDTLDDPVSSDIKLVELNVIPSLGNEPVIDIRSATNDDAYINQYLLFTGGDSGVDSTVRLSKFKFNMYHGEGPAIEIKKFQRLKLVLDDFEISQSRECKGIVRDSESTGGSIHLLGAKLGTEGSEWEPMVLNKITSGFKIYFNSEENYISAGDKLIKMSNDSENKLYFEAEDDDPNARLEIKVGNGGSFIGGVGTVYFDSGHYTIKKGAYYPDFGANTTVIIRGGFIDANAIYGNKSNIYFKGGTHKLDTHTFTVNSDYPNITHAGNGGSIKLNGNGTSFRDKYVGSTIYYLHTVQLKDALGNAVANTPVDAVTGLDSYGINDVYTDEDGKLYLWYEENGSNKLTSVTAGGVEYVYLKQTDANIDDDADTGKYAAQEKTSVFGPYIPLEDLELDKTKLLATDNPLKPLLTFNKKYTGTAVDTSGIYHRLKDIKWTIESDNSPSRITNNQKEDVEVNLSGGNSFKLTAKLDDTVHNYKKEWVFYLPKYVPVDSIKLAEEVILKRGTEYTYTLNDKDVIGTTATVEPDDATFNTIVWSVKDPAGNTVTLTDNKFKPTVTGDYTFTATIENGKTETTPYTQNFTVTCKNVITEGMVTISPVDNAYTGNEVKPSVIIKDDNGYTLKDGTDYTVEYKNNINKTTSTSKAKVIIKGKGSYTTADPDEGLSIDFEIDDLPTGTIKVTDPSLEYSTFQNEDKVAAYINTAATVTITGLESDGTTSLPTDKKKYFISEKYYGTSEELKSVAWTSYSSEFNTTENQKNYIYAKLTGSDGVEAYLSTQCIVDDRTAPDKPVIASGTVVGSTGTVTINANDTLSGIANYYVMAVKKGATAPTADQIKASGVKSSASPVKISGLSVSQEYTFYTVVEDKAGNISEVSDGKDSSIGEGKRSGSIKVMGYTYDKLQGKQEIEDYTNEQKEIKITAAAENGVKSIEYFITDKFYSSASAIEGAAKETKGSGSAAFVVSNWATYNDSARPYLLKNKLNYIYAKITDNGGGVTYISSKGIWEDEIKPTTSSSSSTPKDTTATATVKGTDKESGVKNYYLLVRKDGETAPSKAEDVKSAGMKSEDGKFNVTGLTAATKYTVYAVTEDKAGNLSEIKKSSFTTKKASTTAADAAKKAAAASAAAAAAAGGGSGSGSKTGNGSNVAKRTAGAGGSGSVSGNGDGDSAGSDTIRDGVPFIEDATEGILIGRESTSGWERIEGEVSKAAQPSQVHVDMNGSTVVPAAALKQCQDRDITYYFRLNDDITWAVNGLSFTADPADTDFRVRTDTRNIPSKLINEVADVYPHTNLTIEHDGDFGFTAILSVNVGEENEGMYANLYYYHEDDNSLEFIDSREVDGSGRASFEFMHASDYTVILRGDALTDKSAAALTNDSFTSDDTTSGSSGGPVNVSRKTGSLWLIVVSVISILLCGLILFMPDKKRRRGYAA